MLFHRIEDQGLSHYSYVIGCPGAGEAVVVDPRRDIDVYRDFCDRERLEITHVTETHIHADFASGARQLAMETGARLCLSGYDEGETYEVGFDHRDLREGDRIEVGSVRLEPLHTPGHTPEHLSFLVYDEKRASSTPIILLSGDFLFVGSLGRPDLLGEEAKLGLARQLFESVRGKLADLPDGLEVHPAHGAGSMCGSGMGGRPMSTLGFERLANPYLDPSLTEETFVEKILGSSPPFPEYYKRMKRVNSEGPALLDGLPGLRAVPPAELQDRLEDGHIAIDLRDRLAFGGGHIEGSFGIGAGKSLSQWAAWVVPYGKHLLLVPPHGGAVEESIRGLIRVGLDQVEGWLEGGIDAWYESGRPLRGLEQMTPRELHAAREGGEDIRVLDVRSDGEWADGHIPGAVHIMAGELSDRLDDVPREGRLAVACGSGYRSTVAASVLERNGFDHLLNLTGGMMAWKQAGLPLDG